MADVILFDLDGTITESGIGITRSVAYALEKHGITEREPEKLNRFIGPPLLDTFMTAYGFSDQKARQAVEDYREYYAVKGIFENRVYDGVPEMLEALCGGGRRCILATSKPEQYAVQILEHFNLLRYFSHVCGATMGESRTQKTEVIAYALETAGVADGVMVGDRRYDVEGGKAFGLKTVGVLYGYGSLDELTQASPDYLAATPQEAGEILLHL